MVEPLSTIATVLATAKKLREVAQKVKDAEVKGLIADLSLQLSDLKGQVADLQDENLDLRRQLKAREDLSSLRAHMERRDDVYFLNGAAGRDPGPYCPKCFEVDEKLVPVTKFTGAFKNLGKYNCPNFEKVYG
jgi:hypothetical protein